MFVDALSGSWQSSAALEAMKMVCEFYMIHGLIDAAGSLLKVSTFYASVPFVAGFWINAWFPVR